MEADLAWIEGPDAVGDRPRGRRPGAGPVDATPWPCWPRRSPTREEQALLAAAQEPPGGGARPRRTARDRADGSDDRRGVHGRRGPGAAVARPAVRSRDLVLLTAVIGVVTGLGVALFERITIDVALERALEPPRCGSGPGCPGSGLAITALVLRYVGPFATPSTADEYVKAIPHPEVPFNLQEVPAKLMASLATLGLGGAGGLEGPSIYLGSAVGAGLFGPVNRWLRGDRPSRRPGGRRRRRGGGDLQGPGHRRGLRPGGALPGRHGAPVGAPGPGRRGLRLHRPSSSSTAPSALFPVSGGSALVLADLGVAAVIGITCGLGGPAFAAIIGTAKRLSARGRSRPSRRRLRGRSSPASSCSRTYWFDGQSLARWARATSRSTSASTCRARALGDRRLWRPSASSPPRATVAVGGGRPVHPPRGPGRPHRAAAGRCPRRRQPVAVGGGGRRRVPRARATACPSPR